MDKHLGDLLTPVHRGISRMDTHGHIPAPSPLPGIQSPLFAYSSSYDAPRSLAPLPPPVPIPAPSSTHTSFRAHSGGNMHAAMAAFRLDPTDLDEFSGTSVLGSSCHQCKSRREVSQLSFCTGHCVVDNKYNPCGKKYCDQCLFKFYHQSPASRTGPSEWMCPSCKGACCCAACKRRQRCEKNKWQNANPSVLAMSPATSIACGIVYFGEFGEEAATAMLTDEE